MPTTHTPVKSPLTIIAILAGTVEATALAALPLLDVANQGIFLWFLIGFPPFLTLLFFITLNFNHKTLYSPDDSRDTHAPDLATVFPQPVQPVHTLFASTDPVPKAEPLGACQAHAPKRGLSRLLEIECTDIDGIPAAIEALVTCSGLVARDLLTPAPLLLLVHFEGVEKS